MGWFGKKASPASVAECCLGIELHQGRAYAVHCNQQGVTACYVPEPDELGLSGLENWLAQQAFKGLPVVVSLDSMDYQLHLVEAPAVADEELADALRFRLRDIIPAGREDFIVQGFRLPPDAYRGRMDMAFAAVTEKIVIRKLVSWCRMQQLDLQSIIIPEISLLNLLAEYEPESAVGVLRLDASEGVIYLYRDGGLYMTRRLNIGAGAFVTPADNEGLSLSAGGEMAALSLEVQRSLDYFDSQLGMGIVSEIWVLAPDETDISAALPQFEQGINTPVRYLAPDAFNQMPDRTLTASLATALGNALLWQRGAVS